MAPLLVTLLLYGPAETIAGKYVRHSDRYLELHPTPRSPLPDPLPGTVDALCGLIEAGHDTPELFAALGDALLRAGDGALAYRAFHRAHRARPRDPAWGARMQARKVECAYVPDSVIEREEQAARIWVDALQSFERDRIGRGEDPDDLAGFFERYGRPGDDMWAVIRARRFSGVGGIVALLVGLVFGVFARWLPRRSAWVPGLAGAVALAGPAFVGRTGLLPYGAAVGLAGAVLVVLLGRQRT